MMLDEITKHLAANGFGTRGMDLFYSAMPDKPDEAICVYEYAGGEPLWAINGRMFVNPGLAIHVRGKDYVPVRAKIQAIVDLLDGVANTTIQGGSYHLIAAKQSPFPLGEDANGRPKMAVNFEVVMQ